MSCIPQSLILSFRQGLDIWPKLSSNWQSSWEHRCGLLGPGRSVGFLISSFLSDKVLWYPGWPHSHYRAEDNLDFLPSSCFHCPSSGLTGMSHQVWVTLRIRLKCSLLRWSSQEGRKRNGSEKRKQEEEIDKFMPETGLLLPSDGSCNSAETPAGLSADMPQQGNPQPCP